MSPQSAKFLLFTAFGVASLLAGWAARKRGWLHEDAATRVHFHTVVWVWSVAALLSVWRIPFQMQTLLAVLFQPALMLAAAFGVIPLARAMGCGPRQVGVVALACGTSNNGFTLGSYLCYVLLVPAGQALAIGGAFPMMMVVAGVLTLFPLARHYGGHTAADRSLPVLMALNLLDLRALSLYAAIIGVLLGAAGVPYPTQVERWGLLDAVFYAGAFGGYFGIGLRLRIGWPEVRQNLHLHATLAAVKFLVKPALAILGLALLASLGAGLDEPARSVVLIEAMMPTAVYAVMISNLFHLDARLASSMWVVNHLVFLLMPLPMILFWFG